MLTHLSLFSGIGGIDLAAHWAGFKTVAFCEQNEFCQKVLRKNFGAEIVIFDDVRTLTKESLRQRGISESISLVSGGFPCQDISAAGKGEGITGERSGLWFEMLRIIRDVRPAYVLCENVPALRSRGADIVLSNLEEAGYTAGAFVAGAWSVGAPHRRNRVFILAYSGGSTGDTGTERSGRETRADLSGRSARAGLVVSGGELVRARGDIAGDLGEAAAAERVGRQGEIRRPVTCAGELAHADSTGRREQCGCESVQPQHASAEHGCTCLAGTDEQESMGRIMRWPARPGEQQYEWEAPRVIGLADAEGEQSRRLRQREFHGDALSASNGRTEANGRQVESGMGDSANGIPRRMAGHRVAKLKALGNAVVPQQVYPILKAIADYEASSN